MNVRKGLDVVWTVYHLAMYVQSNRYTILLYNRVYSQIGVLYNVSDLMGPSSGASKPRVRVW
jgi:hypothetical protein